MKTFREHVKTLKEEPTNAVGHNAVAGVNPGDVVVKKKPTQLRRARSFKEHIRTTSDT